MNWSGGSLRVNLNHSHSMSWIKELHFTHFMANPRFAMCEKCKVSAPFSFQFPHHSHLNACFFQISESRLDIYSLNSRWSGVSRNWQGWLSDSNFICFTSIPTGVLFGIFHVSESVGGACICETYFPRFGIFFFPSKFLSAPSIINCCWSLASHSFDCILTMTFPMIFIVLPKPWYAFHEWYRTGWVNLYFC